MNDKTHMLAALPTTYQPTPSGVMHKSVDEHREKIENKSRR